MKKGVFVMGRVCEKVAFARGGKRKFLGMPNVSGAVSRDM